MQKTITNEDIRTMLASETTHELVSLDQNRHRCFLFSVVDLDELFSFSIYSASADESAFIEVMRSQDYKSLSECVADALAQMSIDARELSLSN